MPRWGRVSYQGRERFGTIEDDTIVLHAGDMFANPRPTGESIPLSAAKLLTPTTPSKMVGLVDNYHALVAKLGHAVPAEPLYFLKASNSFLAAGEPIRTPQSYAGKVLFEGELGIVIGKRCRAVAEADAAGYVFGYTCVNDVTAVDILNKDPGFAQWTRAKSFDTFCPLGPWVADVDPTDLEVACFVNGEVRQKARTSDMLFGAWDLVSWVSHAMTLVPGDVILTGTPGGISELHPGDTVEVRIEGVGSLINPVVAAEA
jgi:2-keto-4-pentenoate hydratase/2-oxohepta-3-ene-1,7-dioic acid hydratase in catechol pathway